VSPPPISNKPVRQHVLNGAEVMRSATRGDNESQNRGGGGGGVMVRYPKENATSLVKFPEIRVTDRTGTPAPIEGLAQIDLQRGFLGKKNQTASTQRSITNLGADLDENTANAGRVIGELKQITYPSSPAMYPKRLDPLEGQPKEQKPRIRRQVPEGRLSSSAIVPGMFVLLRVASSAAMSNRHCLIPGDHPFRHDRAVWGTRVARVTNLRCSVMFGLVALAGVVVKRLDRVGSISSIRVTPSPENHH